ncbi:MAG: GNAT family N-acetyltransferase [Leptolyngbyaceae cyanobacterium bins.302]|nr:GNAT family N-acetyltransferase [Leptolyngbyaceae cyanobacterium bins.302]
MSQRPNFILRPVEEHDRQPFLNMSRLAFMPMKTLAEMEQELGDGPINPVERKGWVVEDQAGNLVARYRHFEYSQYFAGVRFPMAGVSSVAVAIERRAQGVAQWMLAQALKNIREQDIPLSMLYPFRHSFYRKLGWAVAGISHQYRVSSRVLPLYEERSRIVAYQPSQETDLKTLYSKVATQHNGWIDRASWTWENFFKPKGGRELYLYKEGETLQGYVVVDFAKLEPEKDQLAVLVREWVAQTPGAYRGLVGFLGTLRDQVTTIVWNCPPDDPFPYLLTEQRHDPALTLPHLSFNFMRLFGMTSGGFMWRLVDPQRAIVLRPVRSLPPFKLSFHIADPVFGKEKFTVEFENGRAQITPQPATTVLRTSVDHLAELFSGLRRSQQLHWTGELELEGEATLLAQLDAAWKTQPPFCWDAF